MTANSDMAAAIGANRRLLEVDCVNSARPISPAASRILRMWSRDSPSFVVESEPFCAPGMIIKNAYAETIRIVSCNASSTERVNEFETGGVRV